MKNPEIVVDDDASAVYAFKHTTHEELGSLNIHKIDGALFVKTHDETRTPYAGKYDLILDDTEVIGELAKLLLTVYLERKRKDHG